MALTKREKVSITAVVIVVLAMAGVYAGSRLSIENHARLYDEQSEQANIRVKQGEKLRLDADEDKALEIDGEQYAAMFSWDGTMEATLDSSDYYRTWDDLSAALSSPAWLKKPESVEGCSYVACKLTLHNVDAVPNVEDRRGNKSFFISDFHLRPGNNELVTFDGCRYGVEGLETPDGYRYILEEGKTASYTLVYEVPSDCDIDSLYMTVYTDGAFGYEKYGIDLDCKG